MRGFAVRGMTMCNKDQLVGYLYDELGAAERRRVRGAPRHMSGMPHRSRGPPADPAAPHDVGAAAAGDQLPHRPRRGRPAPARAAVGSCRSGRWRPPRLLCSPVPPAIANLEMRYGPEGFVVRTGWAQPSAAAVADAAPRCRAPPPAVPCAASSEQLKAAVQALERGSTELERGGATQREGRRRRSAPGSRRRSSGRSSRRARRGSGGAGAAGRAGVEGLQRGAGQRLHAAQDVVGRAQGVNEPAAAAAP